MQLLCDVRPELLSALKPWRRVWGLVIWEKVFASGRWVIPDADVKCIHGESVLMDQPIQFVGVGSLSAGPTVKE